MPSTFFGLNIASSGLSAYQVALNTTANNIANVQTTGYSRQQSNRVASDALGAPAVRSCGNRCYNRVRQADPKSVLRYKILVQSVIGRTV